MKMILFVILLTFQNVNLFSQETTIEESRKGKLKPNSMTFLNYGVALEAQGFGNLFIVGIGMNAFLNLNTELIYGGIGLQIQIGDLMNEYHN